MAGLLREYRNFEECILTEVCWRSGTSILDLQFDYIWWTPNVDDLRVRQEPLPVTLRLRAVDEVRMKLPAQPEAPESAISPAWGRGEIAAVQLGAAASREADTAPFELEARWELDYQIIATFRTMEIAVGGSAPA